MRIITAEERRIRLAHRHRLAPGHRAGTVEEAASSLVCLHGTDPGTVYLSALVRVPGMTVSDLDKAMYQDRTLVKHLAMRRTLFVFPREMLAVAQAGASKQVAERERRSLIKDVEKAGLHEDGTSWLAYAERAVLEVMSDGREATMSELREEIPLLQGAIEYGKGRSWGGMMPVAPRVLTVLSASGQLVRAHNDGGWTSSRPRWMATRHWLGEEIPTMSEDQGLADLVAAWLRAFGPGTETDIKWWLGSTLAAVRKALANIGAMPVDLGGQVGYVMGDDLDQPAAVEPWGALLPGLDPTVMGWKERDWYLGDYGPLLFDNAGNAGPTVWWDGRIVGGWRQGDSGEVQLLLLEDVGPDATEVLEAEAGRMEKWLGGTQAMLRFPAPLWNRPGEAQTAASIGDQSPKE